MEKELELGVVLVQKKPNEGVGGSGRGSLVWIRNKPNYIGFNPPNVSVMTRVIVFLKGLVFVVIDPNIMTSKRLSFVR